MPNQLKKDPTRTTMLQKRFIADMVRRFKAVSREVVEIFIKDDVLGQINLTVNIEAQAWRFHTDPQKVKAFRSWLQRLVDEKILTQVGGISGQPWTAPYIESAYKTGGIRAYVDSRSVFLAEKSELFEGTKADFIRTTFNQPIALEKIELLYERAFTELRGVTDAMGQQMSRILAGGLAEGRHPSVIARRLRDGITKLTNTRAKVIARTEIIRSHAEGQLDSFEKLGVKELGLVAEWSTAGDERVCPECGELEGVVMTVEEARGLLPRHPNCRCMWIPAEKKIRETGQLWGADKDRAIESSIQKEAGKNTLKRSSTEIRRRSVWTGKDVRKGTLKAPLKAADVSAPVKSTPTRIAPNIPWVKAETLKAAEKETIRRGGTPLQYTPNSAANVQIRGTKLAFGELTKSMELDLYKNWSKAFRSTKGFQGLDYSTKGNAFYGLHPESKLKVQNAINNNLANKRYKKIIDKYADGEQAVILRRQAKGMSAAAEEMSGTTHVYDSAFLSDLIEKIPTIGGYTSGTHGGLMAELRHEFGHTLFSNKVSSDFKLKWTTKLGSQSADSIQKGITQFASTKMHIGDEAFCELFAMRTSRLWDASKFPEWVQEMAIMIEKEIF